MNNAFRMSVSACERWFSTVRLLMLSSRAISSLLIPDSRLILYIFCRCGGIFSTTIVTNSSSSLRWMVSSVFVAFLWRAMLFSFFLLIVSEQ
mgnify:CR=1 FL=1